MKSMNILVIGTGLYVSGKGTSGHGTILPAIFEWKRNDKSEGVIHFVSTSVESANQLSSKADQLVEKTGVKIKLESYPRSGPRDEFAYRKVLDERLRSPLVL